MSFGREAIKVLIWRGGTIAVSLLIGALIARFLGPDLRGQFAIVSLSIILATITINLGTPEASIYMIGKGYYEKKDIFQSHFSYSFYCSSVVALVVVALYLLRLFPLHTYFTFPILLISLFIMIVQVVLTQLRHFLLGMKKFDDFNRSIIFENIVYLASVTTCILFFQLTLQTALFSYLVGGFVSLFYNYYLVLRVERSFSLGKINFSLMKKSLGLGWNLYVTGLGGFGIQRINFYLLEFYFGSKAVGFYSVSNTLPTFFENLPQQFSTLMYSFTSNENDPESARKLSAKVARITLFIALIISIPFFVFTKSIILLLYGQDYVSVVPAMNILMSGMIISGITGILFNYLAGIGLPKYGTWLTLIVLVSISAFGFWFIPSFGFVGAAVARTIAGVCGFLFIFYTYLRKSGNTLSESLFIKREDIAQLKQVVVDRLTKLKR